MPAYETYHEKLDKHNIVRTREILSALPPYCQEFSEGLRTGHPREQDWHMLMICGSF